MATDFSQENPTTSSLLSDARSTLQSDDRGQMAIFIALIFQILFVLFAMAINIALVVHDKINLQNATDFAAYYGAQKQAEILNSMGHQNFQLRQAWKLTAFRLNVLGGLGMTNHPLRSGQGGLAQPDTPFLNPVMGNPQTYNYVCVRHRGRQSNAACSAANPCVWGDAPAADNFCKDANFQIRSLPDPSSFTIASITIAAGINAAIANSVQRLRNQVETACRGQGAVNWYMGAKWMFGYRMYQFNQVLLMKALAENLRKPDFATIEGPNVSVGTSKTFHKNLTPENRKSYSFEIANSMASTGNVSQFLVPIHMDANFFYSDLELTGGGGCRGVIRASYEQPSDIGQLPSLVNDSSLPLIQGITFGTGSQNIQSENPDFLYHAGFEKNPWWMTYFGVRARTQPKEIFSPFSVGVPMVARSYAKPFGGRIGPWYRSTWPAGAAESQGTQVDPAGQQRLAYISPDVPNLPSYGRFPGDVTGINSRLAQVSVPKIAGSNASVQSYSFIADISNPENIDLLAQFNNTLREVETMALAPDLFDISYYSIIPNYTRTLRNRIEQNRSALGIPPSVGVPGDHGGPSGPNTNNFSVVDQINLVTSKTNNLDVNMNAYWFVRSPDHMLTSWVSEDYGNYGAPPTAGPGAAFQFPVGRFGRCSVSESDLPGAPLSVDIPPNWCISGGRSGYSVKIVSGDFLASGKHRNGSNNAAGNILNPPSTLRWVTVGQ